MEIVTSQDFQPEIQNALAADAQTA